MISLWDVILIDAESIRPEFRAARAACPKLSKGVVQVVEDLDFETVAYDFAFALRGRDVFRGSLTWP
jgi:hypothetical protein